MLEARGSQVTRETFCTTAQGTRISLLSGINEGEGFLPWCSPSG